MSEQWYFYFSCYRHRRLRWHPRHLCDFFSGISVSPDRPGEGLSFFQDNTIQTVIATMAARYARARARTSITLGHSSLSQEPY